MQRIIRHLALIAPVALAAAAWAARDDAPARPLGHMVFFSLKERTPQNRDRMVAACQKYLTGHPGTVSFSTGTIAEDLAAEVNDRDFDVALHLVFADKAAHDAYQVHPRHLKFIEENKDLWAKVRVFDSYLAGAERR